MSNRPDPVPSEILFKIGIWGLWQMKDKMRDESRGVQSQNRERAGQTS